LTTQKRNLTIIAAIVLVIAIVLSSFVFLNSQKPYAGSVENVSYSGFDSEAYALVYIAQDQHFFESNGINLTVKSFPFSQALDAASNSTVNITPVGDFPFVTNSVLKGQNLTIISNIAKVDSISVIGRRDRGIQNPEDLKGKNIGLTLQQPGEFYLGRFLELQGLTIQDVTLVNLPPPQYAAAIINGTVDAIVSTQPTIGNIQSQLVNNTVMWSVQNEQPAYLLLTCRNDWAAQHPETVVRFLKSLSQAQDFFINNRASADAIVEKKLNITISQQTWSQNQISLSLDQSLILAMQDETQWLISNHLTNTKTTPNFINYIYTSGLETVKPESVNIIG
jgi:ABC-type nitrate/sulfonate/bicarbonate transport system substrate-binding protein